MNLKFLAMIVVIMSMVSCGKTVTVTTESSNIPATVPSNQCSPDFLNAYYDLESRKNFVCIATRLFTVYSNNANESKLVSAITDAEYGRIKFRSYASTSCYEGTELRQGFELYKFTVNAVALGRSALIKARFN